jgi:hypothetical protein
MWIEAVEMRAQSDRDQSWVPEDVLSTDLNSFHEEPELLYLALDYAARRGVPVVVLPYNY